MLHGVVRFLLRVCPKMTKYHKNSNWKPICSTGFLQFQTPNDFIFVFPLWLSCYVSFPCNTPELSPPWCRALRQHPVFFFDVCFELRRDASAPPNGVARSENVAKIDAKSVVRIWSIVLRAMSCDCVIFLTWVTDTVSLKIIVETCVCLFDNERDLSSV